MTRVRNATARQKSVASAAAWHRLYSVQWIRLYAMCGKIVNLMTYQGHNSPCQGREQGLDLQSQYKLTKLKLLSLNRPVDK